MSKMLLVAWSKDFGWTVSLITYVSDSIPALTNYCVEAKSSLHSWASSSRKWIVSSDVQGVALLLLIGDILSYVATATGVGSFYW